MFREYLDIFILMYINDFFIYSNSLKENKEYILITRAIAYLIILKPHVI